jgi:hypothetical protein
LELKIAVAEKEGQFGNTERLPVEAVTRGMVKTQLAKKTTCML